MNKTGIYLVYYDFSDRHEQIYSEEGYYRHLDNAIDTYKVLVNKKFDKEAEVNLEELKQFGYISEESDFGESVVLCEIITED